MRTDFRGTEIAKILLNCHTHKKSNFGREKHPMTIHVSFGFNQVDSSCI